MPCLVSATQHTVYVLLNPDQTGECQVEASSYRMETGLALIPSKTSYLTSVTTDITLILDVATSISPDGSTAIDVARRRR